MLVFNVGDSRVIGQSDKLCVLTRDHKPDHEDELERIEKCGGKVANGRVSGLACSRSLGDTLAHVVGVSA